MPKAFISPNSVTGNIKTPFPDNKVIFPKKYISFYRDIAGAGAIPVIYTVPNGYTFVMLSCYISQAADNASGGGIAQWITNQPSTTGVYNLVGNITINPAAGQTAFQTSTQSYGEGIAFQEKTTFTLDRGSNQNLIGGIAGYLIDKNAISPYFLY